MSLHSLVKKAAADHDERILLLDDDASITTLTAHTLRNLGYGNVEVCHQARDALQILQAGGAPFELVLLDLNMPGMDGVEFVSRLAQLGYRGGIVLMSGMEESVLCDTQRLIDAYGLRATGWLSKPITKERLRRTVERTLAGAVPGVH
jgi:CheY-like chemotaxis protein